MNCRFAAARYGGNAEMTESTPNPSASKLTPEQERFTQTLLRSLRKHEIHTPANLEDCKDLKNFRQTGFYPLHPVVALFSEPGEDSSV